MTTNRLFSPKADIDYDKIYNKLNLEIDIKESIEKFTLKMDIGHGLFVENQDKSELYFTHARSPEVPNGDIYELKDNFNSIVEYLVQEEFDQYRFTVAELHIIIHSEKHAPIMIEKFNISVEEVKKEIDFCKTKIELMTAEYTKSCFKGCDIF